MLEEISKANKNNPSLVSPQTIRNGELKLVASGGWTSGFFPGELWYLYEITGKKNWESEVDYDTATGQVIKRTTHQGYSDQSAWARGQAMGPVRLRDVLS